MSHRRKMSKSSHLCSENTLGRMSSRRGNGKRCQTAAEQGLIGLMLLKWETIKGCGCWLLVKDVCLPLKAHSEYTHYFRSLDLGATSSALQRTIAKVLLKDDSASACPQAALSCRASHRVHVTWTSC